MRRLLFPLATVVLLAASRCASPAPPLQPAPDDHATAEAAIRAADEEWSKSAADNNIDTWMAHYTDDVAALPPNEPTAVGRDATRKSIAAFLATPGLKVSWKTTKVEAAKSGEIGYSYGTYEITFKDAKGKPMSDRGKYLEVWKKQSDGTWKCAADMFSSDLPLPSTK
jgi:ketosteroid isomerase-like protein